MVMHVSQKWLFLRAVFVTFIVLVVIISRRPDAITRPQFFAEDGVYWYAQAYELGLIKPLLTPITGYLQSYSRIVGWISLAFPMSIAPLVFNVGAIIAMAAPALLLLSSRFKRYPMRARLFIVCVYLLLSNTSEIYINLTNAQWYLALLSFMVINAEYSRNIFSRSLDYLILMVSGLSGPFSILLTPVIAVHYISNYGQRNNNINKYVIVLGTAIIQFIVLLTHLESRQSMLYFPKLVELYEILHRQIIWGLLVGQNGYDWIVMKIPSTHVFFGFTSLMACIIFVYTLIKADMSIKLMLLFGTLTLLSGVFLPTTTATKTMSVGDILANTYGIRYWFIPMIAWLVALVACCGNKNNIVIRCISIFFIACMVLFTIKNYRFVHNYQYREYANLQFSSHAREFEVAKVGTVARIPLNPSGWYMNLTKK